MKLDLLYEIDIPRPWPGPHPHGQRKAEQLKYKEALEQIKLADALGFRTVWLVEHHFREQRSHLPSNDVLIGALSQCTENLRLGFGVVLMPHPFQHPARVAEKVATADILSGGRVEWGTGRSTPMEQEGFRVPMEESREMWKSAVQSVVGMWESEYYEEHSKYLDFPRRMVTPKPVQDPHPPPWMAASSPGSSAVAGKLGLGLLHFAIFQPVEAMAEQIRLYREAIADPEPLTQVVNNRAAVYTLVHCAESMKEAEANGIWDSLWWWYRHLAEFTLTWDAPLLGPEAAERMFPELRLHKEGKFNPRQFNEQDMIILGDPEQCLEKILRYQELGVDQLICYVQFAQLPHESVMRTIELLGTEVIPELEKRAVSRVP